MIPVQQPHVARSLEYGIYRDGDNNLDASQEDAVTQAERVSARNANVQFTVEDTSLQSGTHRFTIDGGTRRPEDAPPRDDMASPSNLAEFVARTLDHAETSGAKQTWIELVDHGAGDGGGLEADSFKQIMPMPQIAQAIADGIKLHAQRHPEDADRKVDGVVANQCLMASLGFADALSHAGVKYLAASPETMVSPGVPSIAADAIAKHVDDPAAMADAIVRDTMNYKYGDGIFSYTPAAAFDVLDLDRAKMADVESSVKSLNDDIAATRDAGAIAALRADAKKNQGMARIPDATPDMPWHADRPAIALYDTIAKDGRLNEATRADARAAETAVQGLVLAHAESHDYAPFGGANYAKAAGPTVHFPVKPAQVDPWAPRVSETHNRFFNETDAAAAERVIA